MSEIDIENVTADIHDLLFGNPHAVGTDLRGESAEVQMITEYGEIHFTLFGQNYTITVSADKREDDNPEIARLKAENAALRDYIRASENGATCVYTYVYPEEVDAIDLAYTALTEGWVETEFNLSGLSRFRHAVQRRMNDGN